MLLKKVPILMVPQGRTKAKKPKRTKENSKVCRDIFSFLLDLGGQFSPLLPSKQELKTD